MLKVIKCEQTLIPKTAEGRKYADEYECKLRSTGAFKSRVTHPTFIQIDAEYTENIKEGDTEE